MGVGKGSIAREIIKHSDYISIDTDDVIESMENRKLKPFLKKRVRSILESLKKMSHFGLKKALKTPLSQPAADFIK